MRILVVEDEPKIANSIKKGLEQENFFADVAYDGEDGYSYAKTDSYDVIILDILLPGIDGLEVIKRLRKNKIHTPVLMLTALGAIDDKVGGLNSGADDYLTKPFAFEELLARVRALGRRPKNGGETTLQVDNLELDPVSYSVKRAGKPIDLSKKEFSLLEYLMRNKDKVVTKESIIENVWDYESNILPNTVEVFIGYLRKKVDDAGYGEELIHTVRGFGYKIGKAGK